MEERIKKLELELESLRYEFRKKTGAGSNDLRPANYKSADGSTGVTTLVTTDDLVGKTLTFKNGILVNFS
jgi:hypothetical protein